MKEFAVPGKSSKNIPTHRRQGLGRGLFREWREIALASDASKNTSSDERLTALVVDDMPNMRLHLCKLLSQLEIQTLESCNGVEAIDLLRSQRVDLVVTDLVMPEMDGFELCEEVRRQPELRQLPIIVTSSHRDASYVIRALRRGADDYITKPSTLASIKAVIERVMSHV